MQKEANITVHEDHEKAVNQVSLIKKRMNEIQVEIGENKMTLWDFSQKQLSL